MDSSWLPTLDQIDAFGSLLGGVGTILAVAFAVYGYSQWRVDLRGKRQFEVAEKMMLALADVKTAFAMIFYKGSKPEEMTVYFQQKNIEPPTDLLRYAGHLISKRLEGRKDKFHALYEAGRYADVYLAPEVGGVVGEVQMVHGTILVNALKLIDSTSSTIDRDTWYEEIYAPDSDLRKKIIKADTDLRAICLPYLGRV